MHETTVYLAGPEVFLQSQTTLTRKKELCKEYGFEGLSPLDNEVDFASFPTKEAAGIYIAIANERMISRADFVIANLTPFRGPSADVGTAYELGYARALDKPVFGYTNNPRGFLERTKRDVWPHVEWVEKDLDPLGMTIEDFNLFDNLMLAGALASRGGVVTHESDSGLAWYTDLEGFEACLRRAKERFK